MADRLGSDLYAALRASIADGDTITTVANGNPNFVTEVTEVGVFVETERSRQLGRPPQLVPAAMIQKGWDHLRRSGRLTNQYLVAAEGLNVKRSAAVCALLARLPNVRVRSSRPIVLELRRP